MPTIDFDDFASLALGAGFCALLVGSYAVGLVSRRFLPARHQTHESLEIVHAIIGMLVAMIAILLGLQLDAANKSFDGIAQLVDRYGIQITELDAQLREYGAEADVARGKLRDYTAAALKSLESGDTSDHHEQGEALRGVNRAVLRLVPTSLVQSHTQSESLTLLDTMFQERWQLVAGARISPNVPLYSVLLFWLVLVYLAFGLNAAFNVPVFLVLTVSAAAIGAAVFVLSDMLTPFSGLISISPQSLREAVANISQAGP